MSHVAELPGCFALGTTVPLAVAATPGAITKFLAWLKSHKEPLVPEAHVVRPTMVDLGIAEVRESGAPLELFPFDIEAWDDYKLERTLRWLSYSRADLLAKLEGMSQSDLERKPIAANRTLHQTLSHIANVEFGYVSNIVGGLEGKEAVDETHPADIRERLETVREILVHHVRSIPAENRGAVLYPTWGGGKGEPWTLAKCLRRALEHEREHLAELTW